MLVDSNCVPPMEGYSDVCEAGYEVRWIKKVSCKVQQQIIDKRALTSGGLSCNDGAQHRVCAWCFDDESSSKRFTCGAVVSAWD